MKTLADRVRESRNEAGLSQSALARECGVDPSAINKIERGDTLTLSGKLLAGLCKALGVMPDWMENGKPPKRSGKVSDLMDLSEHPDLVSVRRVKFKLSAGVQGYAIEPQDGNGVPIFFRKDWLKSKGYRADKLVAVRIAGASMEPGLYDGDLVVVNTDDAMPCDGEVFAVNYEGEMGIKRLKRDSGEWWLASDNHDKRRYPDKRCNGDVQLIGRVIYKQSERV